MNCPYCGEIAKLVDSSVIYKRSYGPAWVCSKYPVCDAYVGCHPGTDKPLGRLANKELREAKMAAHRAFDPFWRGIVDPNKSRNQVRNDAYRLLAEALGIPFQLCHIGMFDVDQCRKVVEVCKTTMLGIPTYPESPRV